MMYEMKTRYDLKMLYRKRFHKNPNTVFLVMTPEHNNLGDHAIALAETIFLKKHGINYIEITGRELNEMKLKKSLSVMNGYPILITGGGNLGTLWMNVEMMEREIITQNPRSDIFILPNTIFYEDSDWGRSEFEKSIKLYNRHKNLYLYAREKNSFEIMQKAFQNVKLIPDMVLSLDQCGEKKERNGCLLCLRKDCERTRTDRQEQIIRQQASELFGDAVSNTDMVVEGKVLAAQRQEALNTKFNQFSGAELVITDRLHGMIFCAITGTPCIVIDSKSPKIRGCYEWIQNLDYIRFTDDVSQIVKEYQKIPQTEHQYENTQLQEYYLELANDILAKI